MNFVQVAIPSPLRQTFTYKNQSKCDLVGKRVLVEFGRRKLVGVVTSQSEEFNEKYKLKQFDKLDYPAKPRWPLDENAKFLKGAGVKL